jgi:hypothetical protein
MTATTSEDKERWIATINGCLGRLKSQDTMTIRKEERKSAAKQSSTGQWLLRKRDAEDRTPVTQTPSQLTGVTDLKQDHDLESQQIRGQLQHMMRMCEDLQETIKVLTSEKESLNQRLNEENSKAKRLEIDLALERGKNQGYEEAMRIRVPREFPAQQELNSNLYQSTASISAAPFSSTDYTLETSSAITRKERSPSTASTENEEQLTEQMKQLTFLLETIAGRGKERAVRN